TSLKPDEILVEFRLPRRAEYGGDAYQRFIPRTERDIAVVGVGVNLTLDQNGVCQAARVALGAVSPTPLLVDGASAALLNASFDEQSLARAAAATSAACNPINDKRGTIEYRTQITAVIFKRTAAIALERARQTL
ncbi:MAG: FAD binding domain-containing protein, partial [Pseudomonadales bacterium]